MELTRRDLELLGYLDEQGIALSFQLQERFFPNINAFKSRIFQLKKAGLIESLRLRDFKNELPQKFRFIKEILKKRGISFHLARVYRRALKKKQPDRNSIVTPIMWSHQIGLNEIRKHLEAMFPEKSFVVSDPELRREWARFSFGRNVPIPDLAIRTPNGDIAIEFERTKKSKPEYFDRAFCYEKSDFKSVLYVCASNEIMREILNCSSSVKRISVSEFGNLNKSFSVFSGSFPTKNIFL
jgi:hypothetical protein